MLKAPIPDWNRDGEKMAEGLIKAEWFSPCDPDYKKALDRLRAVGVKWEYQRVKQPA